MSDPLVQASVEAIRTAAARLGVDPFRLARFLAHGRIADSLQALGRAQALQLEQAHAAAIQERYLRFLESEMRDAGGPDRSVERD